MKKLQLLIKYKFNKGWWGEVGLEVLGWRMLDWSAFSSYLTVEVSWSPKD
jgi:hypothetical protein